MSPPNFWGIISSHYRSEKVDTRPFVMSSIIIIIIITIIIIIIIIIIISWSYDKNFRPL